MNEFTIGQLAKKLNTTRVAIRHYERYGLLANVKRSPGGFRLYTTDDLCRLQFVLNAKKAGFELNEILELITIQKDPNASKRDVNQMLLSKLDNMNEKINILQGMAKQLEQLAHRCDGKGPLNECPILKALHKDSRTEDIESEIT